MSFEIQKIKLDTPIEGFEDWAEYRIPKEGDYYLDVEDGEFVTGRWELEQSISPWIILTPDNPALILVNSLAEYVESVDWGVATYNANQVLEQLKEISSAIQEGY